MNVFKNKRFKKPAKLVTGFILLFFILNPVFGFDGANIPDSADFMSFYQEEMYEYVKMLSDGTELPLYISAYMNMLYVTNQRMPFLANITLGSFLRLNENFFLPLNISYASTQVMSDFGNFHYGNSNFVNSQIFLNSGIVYGHKRLGTIGLFAGYNFDFTWDILDYDPADIPAGYGNNGGFKFLIVPMINTAELPFVEYAIRTISGYLNMDLSNEIDFSIRLTFQPIIIKNFSINIIEPYYSSKRCHIYAKYNVYGVLFDFNINNKFLFFLDFGYKDYFDVTYDYSAFEDTPYLRAGFPFENKILSKLGFNDLHLYFYIDREYIAPKIGLNYSTGKSGRGIIEFGFYRSFSIILAYRFVF